MIIHKADTALETVLKANGRARTHTVTTLAELTEIAARAERKLDKLMLPLAYRTGSVVRFVGAGPSAKAYKNTVIVSDIELRRRSDRTWDLVSASTARGYPASPEYFVVTLTARQREEASTRVLAAAFKGTAVVESASAAA